MFEYTEAYLKPFQWAKQAYQYMLGTAVNRQIDISKVDLINPILPTINTNPINIFTDSDWNVTSLDQLSTLAGLYKSIDQASEYYNSLYTLITARLQESEKRIQEQDSNLRVLLSSSRSISTTSIHLKGGDTSTIETNEKYYRVFGPLESVPNEGIFRLKDTGSFSSIRSLGGFAGSVSIDFTLGEITNSGDLSAITDGTRNTFWLGTFFTPGPVRADQNDIAWLPAEYKHGYACIISYYMDRPTIATEVFVDPITTEPMDLVSISWTPLNLNSAIANGTFLSSSNWSYTGGASFSSSALGLGVASGACVVIGSSGWVSQTFGVSGNYLTVAGTTLVNEGRRCQINYSMRGLGDLVSGARIVWLNVSGEVIEYKLQETFPTGFYSGYKLVDFVPTGATSGRVDLGIFSPTAAASAFFDSVEVLMGEKSFPCQEIIDRPKTISLPEIVRSGRFSFVFAQRNPRREVQAKEAAVVDIPDLTNLYLDSSLQRAASQITNLLANPGPGTSIFSYRVGLKELDLRYREHIPRGSLVSLPLISRKEIRNLWVTAEIGQFFNDNSQFYIYPFAENSELKTRIEPFGIGEVDAATTFFLRNGEILKIHTFEEQRAGWVNTLDKVFITDPKDITEVHDGTDREGRVRLEFAPHLRRVYLKEIQDWLKAYSIWSSPFDPNLGIVYGLPSGMQATISAIRNNMTSGFNLTDLVSREGYLPIQVTISNDKWTATPDVYGRPDISKVRTALLEQLTETTVVETSIEVKEDFISFDTWMNSTTIAQFLQYKESDQSGASGKSYFSSISESKYTTTTIKQAYDALIKNNLNFKRIYDTYFTATYNLLRASGRLGKNTNTSRTTTAAVEHDDVFATRYKPIITGPAGTFIQLYWYNPTTFHYQPMPRSAYEVMDSTMGLIKVLQSAPSSGFTSILADYKYISYTEVEDHYGSILSFSTVTSALSGAIAASIGTTSKNFPITRNMTDYEDGIIPTLRTPNFDRLSKDYYPVIEYYVNNEGELIFARDFFRYGDIPSRITVSYQTLAIQPRLALEVTRSGSPAATPTIYNLSLRVRESSPLPTREGT